MVLVQFHPTLKTHKEHHVVKLDGHIRKILKERMNELYTKNEIVK